jgi:hypothetical protein
LNSYLRSWAHIGDILRGSTTSGATIAGGFYRPVQIVLYLIAYQLGGGSTFPFHALNLAIHIANACLVFRLGSKFGFHPWGVFIAALVWSVHPLHTEAVTYMSATADPLFAFFCLVSVVWLAPDFTPQKILKIIPLFLLGLFSKETTVMLPLLIMSCIFLTSLRPTDFRQYLRTWPLWIITLIYTIWRSQASGFDGPQTYKHLYALPEFATLRMYSEHPLYRLQTFFATLPDYLTLLTWPTGLHMERAFSIFVHMTEAPVLIGCGLSVVAMGEIVRSSTKPPTGRAMGWGLLWFGAAHAPDSGILIPMNSLFLEHWMYVPSIGLFLGIAQTIATIAQGRLRPIGYACAAAAVVFAVFMADKTYAQNAIWHDPVSFYTNIFDHGEKSARAHNNLALYYADHGEPDKALAQFKQAIDLSDTYAETRHNLALTYLHMPDPAAHIDDAIENLKRALEIDPRFYRSAQALAAIYSQRGDTETARMYQDRANALIDQR